MTASTGSSHPSAPPVLVVREGKGVARISLNRPHVRNAWDQATVRELTRVFAELAAQDVRAAVITGSGDAFSAGGDLVWMKGVLERSPIEQRQDAEAIMTLLETVDSFPYPLIARVNGPAFGGGFGLVCTADIAVASETARFGLSEVRLGVVPGTISPFVARRIGAGAVRGHCLSGAAMTAQTALAIGLVHQVVPAAELDAAVDACVRQFLKCAPAAVRETKRLFRAVAYGSAETARAVAIESIVSVWAGDEARLGISAFLAKEAAPWCE